MRYEVQKANGSTNKTGIKNPKLFNTPYLTGTKLRGYSQIEKSTPNITPDTNNIESAFTFKKKQTRKNTAHTDRKKSDVDMLKNHVNISSNFKP